MREIKFRAWDGNYMLTRIDPIRDGEPLNTFFKDTHYIFMQSTGLKDKNGVEIYEGDIVRVLMNHIADLAPELPDEEYIYKVWFDEETACFKFNDMTLNYVILRDQFHKLEVIGNIYENPELLEQHNE